MEIHFCLLQTSCSLHSLGPYRAGNLIDSKECWKPDLEQVANYNWVRHDYKGFGAKGQLVDPSTLNEPVPSCS